MKKVGKDDVQVDTKESMMKTRGQESMRFRMTGKYEEKEILIKDRKTEGSDFKEQKEKTKKFRVGWRGERRMK